MPTTIRSLSPKVGDQIKIMGSGGLKATVIAYDPTDPGMPYMLGWKLGEDSGEAVYTCLDGSILDPRIIKGAIIIPDIEQYVINRWILHSELVEPILGAISTTIVSSGMTCSGKNCPAPFNQFATPNQSDGSYLCYSCRTRPSWAR